MVKGPHHLPYIQRLQRLNVCSLEKRRCLSDLTPGYVIFHGSYDLPHYLFFSLPSCSHLRGHDLKLVHRSFHFARRKAAFSVRVVEPWNKLPPFIINSPSIAIFNAPWVLHALEDILAFHLGGISMVGRGTRWDWSIPEHQISPS